MSLLPQPPPAHWSTLLSYDSHTSADEYVFLQKLILSPQAAFAYSLPSTRSSVLLLNAGLSRSPNQGFDSSLISGDCESGKSVAW
ncbi:hypothetical protein Nepgr_000116 [Nepenthes gracilis]|uniref:Uncharacterized protein n=1 Tax=Nepenthes gracilis TaxID=150966 RepID=A0AAD3RVA8_NEPGR|nr:hypothetical protein Nepgr_000116 [Nepenthes gracilis]